MTQAKKHLLISIAIFAVAFISLIIFIGSNASGAINTLSDNIKLVEKPVTETPEQESQPVQVTESAPVAPEPSISAQVPVKESVVAPQETKGAEIPERIPFTNKPVEAGNPESYVGTYGQCPFYENAGPKGCTPPPDIQCNEDWSVCSYKGDAQ